MSEESQKNRRRRRRPRSSSKTKAKPKARETKSASSGAKASSGRRRPRKRGGKSKDRKGSSPLTVQQHKDQSVSPINKDIFIYTYTLRPRSLLDQYEAGPNLAERMEFEQVDEKALID